MVSWLVGERLTIKGHSEYLTGGGRWRFEQGRGVIMFVGKSDMEGVNNF